MYIFIRDNAFIEYSISEFFLLLIIISRILLCSLSILFVLNIL